MDEREQEEMAMWGADKIILELGEELVGYLWTDEWVRLMSSLLENRMFDGIGHAKSKSLEIMQLVLGIRTSVLLGEGVTGVYASVARVAVERYMLEYMPVEDNICPACGVPWDRHDRESCMYAYFDVNG